MTYPVTSRSNSLKSIKRLRLGSVPMKHGYRNVPFLSNTASLSGHIKPTTGRVHSPMDLKRTLQLLEKLRCSAKKWGQFLNNNC